MNTFLPYESFEESAKCLDYKRLGKQRVEAYQILKALFHGGGWENHPATKMWRGYEDALGLYMNCMIEEWIRRGYKNTMKMWPLTEIVIYPDWLGDELIHRSHRSNLLRKDPSWYSQYKWIEPDNIDYFWPGE